MERKNVWTTYSEKELEELEQLNSQYKEFLDRGKTERECAAVTIEMAKDIRIWQISFRKIKN